MDHAAPGGSNWHRELLAQMSSGTSSREAVISKSLERNLAEYLAFRHFYRHSYSFFLEWDELEPLVSSPNEIWQQIQSEVENFLEGLPGKG